MTDQPRVPAGSSEGGQFASKGGAGAGRGVRAAGDWDKRAVKFSDDPKKMYPDAPVFPEKSAAEVRGLRDELSEAGRLNSDGTVSVYHVTLSEPDDVVREGLIPGKVPAPGQNWTAQHSKYATYFHVDREVAERDIEFGGAVIEARLPVTPKVLARLIPDEESGTGNDLAINILLQREGGAIAVIGGVPSNALRISKVVNP